jgi:hypothetical protein
VTGVAGTSGLKCRAVFFTARNLAAGWRVGSAEFVGGQFNFADGEGALAIVFEVPTGGSGSRTLSEVELMGPDCARWRQAFSRTPVEPGLPDAGSRAGGGEDADSPMPP